LIAASSADGFLAGSVCIVLRGRVTLDAKVRNCSNAAAAAVIIIDSTGDAIGPDLDECSTCVCFLILLHSQSTPQQLSALYSHAFSCWNTYNAREALMYLQYCRWLHPFCVRWS
jgi:hypothetical protein